MKIDPTLRPSDSEPELIGNRWVWPSGFSLPAARGGEGEGDVGGEGGTGEAGAGEGGAGGAPPKGADGKTDAERGYPEATPVADMTPVQQAAYWKTQSRKHEERSRERGDYDALKTKAEQYDALLATTATDKEREIAAARTEAAEAATAAARSEAMPRLVDAEIKAVAAGRVDPARLAAAIEPLDRSKFLTDTGEIDPDKVTTFVATIAPAEGSSSKKAFPDLGQGRRTGADTASVSRGAERYADRHPARKS